MRNKAVLLLVLILVSISLDFPLAYCVEKLPKSWDEKYADEPYVRLFAEEVLELEKDFTSTEKFHGIERIQKESAKSKGEISLQYDKSRQIFKGFSAFTITPEGEKLKYKKIQELTPYSGFAVYTDMREKVITLPNVVVGSTIDWSGEITKFKPTIKGQFFEVTYMTEPFPIKLSKRTFIAPRDTPIRIQFINGVPKEKKEYSKDKVIYTWIAEGNDKVKMEEFMPDSEDLSQKILISTLTDWKQISDWYWELFKKNMKTSPEIKEQVRKIIENKTTERDKIQSIIEYMQENLRYVSMNLDFHNYEPHPANQTFSNKYGDCKDQTLLAIVMLSEVGIKAYPALYREGWRDDPSQQLPMPMYFEHVILCIENAGKRYYTDIFIKDYYFDEVPPTSSDGYVFVVNDTGGFFDRVPTIDKKKHSENTEATVFLREDGSAFTELKAIAPRDLSARLREGYKNSTKEEKENFFASLEELFSLGGKMIENKWENLDKSYSNLKLHAKFERPNYAEVMGDFLTFGLGAYERSSAFSSPTRRNPIVLWNEDISETKMEYVLPEKFEILNIPKNIKLKTEFVDYSRTYEKEGNRIREIERIERKRVRLPPERYKELQDFMNERTKLTQNRIMIKKKN
jgi:transglutaminase-like putative cysteine protease